MGAKASANDSIHEIKKGIIYRLSLASSLCFTFVTQCCPRSWPELLTINSHWASDASSLQRARLATSLVSPIAGRTSQSQQDSVTRADLHVLSVGHSGVLFADPLHEDDSASSIPMNLSREPCAIYSGWTRGSLRWYAQHMRTLQHSAEKSCQKLHIPSITSDCLNGSQLLENG